MWSPLRFSIMNIILILVCFRYALSASSSNGKTGKQDYDDEEDVGQTLTLPDSETDIVVPEEDENQNDEDQTVYDEPDDDAFGVLYRVYRVVMPDEEDAVDSNVDHIDARGNRKKYGQWVVGAPRRPPPTFLKPAESGWRQTGRGGDVGRDAMKVFEERPTRRDMGTAAVPPEITEHPAAEVAYKPGESVVLPCKARGEAELTFTWYKSGTELETSPASDIQLLEDGSLVMRKPEDGVYQCFVTNNFGTAVSYKSLVRAALLDTFPTASNVTTHHPTVGSYLRLQCTSPKSYPSAVVYWSKLKDGSISTPVESSERISLDYEGGLHFANVLPEDEQSIDSSYTCTVHNLVLRSLVQGNDQRVQPVDAGTPNDVAPKLQWSSPQHSVVVKGATVKLKCIFSGYPTPTVSWSRVDGRPMSSRANPTSSFGQELVINAVGHDDAGEYECSAKSTNAEDVVTYAFTVVVESIPYWRQNQPPKNTEVMDEEDARFECHADGIPKPTISWAVNGVPVEELLPDIRRTVGPDYLEYVNVTRTDTQVVQCNASNKHGYIFGNAFLTVRADPPSFISILPQKMKIAKGQSAVLKCEADGAPIPVQMWFKNGIEIDRVTHHPNAFLRILNASAADNGTYHCKVVNKFGVGDAYGDLLVRENTRIIDPPMSDTVLAGSSITLKCGVKTDPHEIPNLQIEWLINGEPVDPPSESSNNSYYIKEAAVQNTGHYTCRASNGIDFDEYSADIVVQDRPEPPIDVQFSDCSGGSTVVSWTPGNDNNDPITSFAVFAHCSFDEPDEMHDIAVVSADEPHSVEVPLLPWRNYSFHVIAANSIGNSDSSSTMSHSEVCTVPPAVPSVNPLGVCARQGTSTELIITWQPMTIKQMNGDRFHYIVRYRLYGSTDWNEETLWDRSQRELILSGQQTFKKYEVTVQSANSLGVSKATPGQTIVYSGQGIPLAAPQNLQITNGAPSSGSVVFSWDAVPEEPETLRGFLKGYRVRYWKADNVMTNRTHEVLLNRTTKMCEGASDGIDELAEAGIDYEIDEFTEHFTEPQREAEAGIDDEKDEITEHFREHRRRKRDAGTDRVSVTANEIWPFTKISATVVILTDMGAGEPSEPVSFVTAEGVPGPVTEAFVAETGSTHIRLKWFLPAEENGVITGYTVKYEPVDTSERHQKAEAVPDREQMKITLSGLDPDTEYNVDICAKTSAGCGQKVTLKQRTLKPGVPFKPSIADITYGDNWFNVIWRSESDGQPPSHHFVQHVKKGTTDLKKVNVDDEQMSVNVTDLEPGFIYIIQVVAVSGEFNSSSVETEVAVGTPPKLTVSASESPIVVTSSAGMPIWIIVVCIIIAVIIIIIVVACFVRRRRAAARNNYPVQKKDPCRNGNAKPLSDEESCLKDPPIVPQKSPDASMTPADLGKSSASLISNKSGGHADSDVDSLDDDPDTTKFNEDGSFIGIYTNSTSDADPLTTTAAPTAV